MTVPVSPDELTGPPHGGMTPDRSENETMLQRTIPATLVALVVLSLALVAWPADSATARRTGAVADAFEVDAAHSTLIFRIRHFGVCWFHGRINQPTGDFLLDANDLESSYVNVEVELRRMDAGNRSRDQFLLSPDFFNAKEYPTASFRSSRISRDDDGTFRATGTFTMHGVSKEITVPLTDYAEADVPKFGYRAGFEAIFTVNRSDFGMDARIDDGTLGDATRITIAVEGVRR